MTNSDWVQLKELADSPQRPLLWMRVKPQLTADLSFLLDSQRQHAADRPGRPRSLRGLKKLSASMLSDDGSAKLTAAIQEQLTKIIVEVEQASVPEDTIANLKNTDHIVRDVARRVFMGELSALVESRRPKSRTPGAESISEAATTDSGPTRLSRRDSSPSPEPPALSQSMLLPSPPFTDADIALCLEELRRADPTTGLQLTDFISELESMADES